MSSVAVPNAVTVRVMKQVVIDGDLQGLTDDEKLVYYKARCKSAGLDPSAKPFGYYKDKRTGKLSLYAEKAAAEQLAMNHGIGVVIDYNKKEGGDLPYYIVKVKGQDSKRRVSENIACVTLFRQTFVKDPDQSDDPKNPGEGRVRGDHWYYDQSMGRRTKETVWGFWETKQFIGEELCNAMMKCVTKAQRRLILSMTGLGMVDESELETMDVEKVSPESSEVAPATEQEDLAAEWVARIMEAETEDELRAHVSDMEEAGVSGIVGEELAAHISDAFAERLGQIKLGEVEANA